ncbi:hypothetical protein Tco_0816559 [Tanacetum coccineum]
MKDGSSLQQQDIGNMADLHVILLSQSPSKGSDTTCRLPRNMSQHTIAALRIGQDNCILEARVYQKWNSKNISDMKELAFCYILIDREFCDIKQGSTSIDKGTSRHLYGHTSTKGTTSNQRRDSDTKEVDINKKTENRAKMTKAEHGMEKTVKNQGQRPKKSKSKSIQKNQQSNLEPELKNYY